MAKIIRAFDGFIMFMFFFINNRLERLIIYSVPQQLVGIKLFVSAQQSDFSPRKSWFFFCFCLLETVEGGNRCYK